MNEMIVILSTYITIILSTVFTLSTLS